MRQYNEKPSQISNLGADIKGAHRHRNDTYENPEKRAERERVKKAKNDLKDAKTLFIGLFKTALSESTEAAILVLKDYERQVALMSCGLDTSTTMDQFRALVINESNRDKKEVLRRAFNKAARKISKIRYIRPIELTNYFEPKTREAFTEVNGHKGTWTLSAPIDLESAKNFLETHVNGVQFGNSVPDAEREYCLSGLATALHTLSIMFKIDFKDIGFSFGARGKAGSVAHYQDSNKVVAINRHWDGALIHEIGHALDYKLGLVSYKMPYGIVADYRHKLIEAKIPNYKYYANRKEIFARMIEGYLQKHLPILSDFALEKTQATVIPEMTEETEAWLREVLKEVLK